MDEPEKVALGIEAQKAVLIRRLYWKFETIR